MHPTKLFKSSTFRLALVYMAMFSLSVLLLLGFIYWSTAGYMMRQAEATIEAEITGLAEHYEQAGHLGLRKIISERLSRQNDSSSIYLLADQEFQPIIGNLNKWPKMESPEQGWVSFDSDSNPDDGVGPHKSRARTFRLRGGLYLLVGRDVHDLEEIQSLIQEALFWGLLITIVLALGGGVMMSQTMMHRIETINTTCRQIMAGDLAQRIPSTGGDDDLDRLVKTLNQMLEQIEELMQGVKQVTNNIAHDLRTPLTRLRRRLDMLRENDNSILNNDELLEQAIAEADGLLITFKALLRISEVETGNRRVGFEDVNMTALLQDMVESTSLYARRKIKPLLWRRAPPDLSWAIEICSFRLLPTSWTTRLSTRQHQGKFDSSCMINPINCRLSSVILDQVSRLQPEREFLSDFSASRRVDLPPETVLA